MYLFFSDLHCHNWPQFSTRLANGLNSRFQDCLNILDQAATIVQQYHVQHVFFLGDLFESRTKIDIDVWNKTWQAMKRLTEVTPQRVWLLKGNHDCHDKIGSVHSLEHFRPLCEVIAKPWVCLPIANAHIAAFPYTDDVATLKQQLAELTSVDLVLLHQSIREGTIGPYSRTIAAELSLSDLPMDRTRYVFAGDYHKRQFFGPDNRVHYIGSPLQLKSDEAGEEKGFTLVDPATWQLYTVPSVAPRFCLFETPRAAEIAIDEQQVDTERDFVRVRYESSDAAAAERLKDSFPSIQLDRQRPQRQPLARTTAAVTTDDRALVTEYVQQRNTNYDQQRLIDVGMQLLTS